MDNEFWPFRLVSLLSCGETSLAGGYVTFRASIPSFFILVISVVRLRPIRTAAPLAPPTRPLVSFRIRTILSCSSNFSTLPSAELMDPSSNSGTTISSLSVRARTTARSTRFSNSRTFPGQCHRASVRIDAAEMLVDLLLHAANILLREIPHEQRNVLRALTQRWNSNRNYVQSIIEVASKLFLVNHLLQISIGCGHQANINFQRPCTAQAFEFAFLQCAQEFRLDLQRNISYLVQKQRASICQFKPSGFCVIAPVKAPRS